MAVVETEAERKSVDQSEKKYMVAGAAVHAMWSVLESLDTPGDENRLLHHIQSAYPHMAHTDCNSVTTPRAHQTPIAAAFQDPHRPPTDWYWFFAGQSGQLLDDSLRRPRPTGSGRRRLRPRRTTQVGESGSPEDGGPTPGTSPRRGVVVDGLLGRHPPTGPDPDWVLRTGF